LPRSRAPFKPHEPKIKVGRVFRNWPARKADSQKQSQMRRTGMSDPHNQSQCMGQECPTHTIKANAQECPTPHSLLSTQQSRSNASDRNVRPTQSKPMHKNVRPHIVCCRPNNHGQMRRTGMSDPHGLLWTHASNTQRARSLRYCIPMSLPSGFEIRRASTAASGDVGRAPRGHVPRHGVQRRGCARLDVGKI
jgi:hypothetical protein